MWVTGCAAAETVTVTQANAVTTLRAVTEPMAQTPDDWISV